MTVAADAPAKRRACAALLLVPLFLGGCAERLSGGAATAVLPSEMQPAYEAFRAFYEPYYFAVSLDGMAYGYTACKAIGQCRRAGTRQKAIQLCESQAKGVPCRVYARGSNIVWDGPAIGDRSALSRTAPPTPDQGPSKPVTLRDYRLPDGFVLSMVHDRCLTVGGTVL